MKIGKAREGEFIRPSERQRDCSDRRQPASSQDPGPPLTTNVPKTRVASPIDPETALCPAPGGSVISNSVAIAGSQMSAGSRWCDLPDSVKKALESAGSNEFALDGRVRDALNRMTGDVWPGDAFARKCLRS